MSLEVAGVAFSSPSRKVHIPAQFNC
jgi:hypothetical protein